MFCPLTHHHPHRGFNLIEAAIVLGVVGLVIGGIWVAAAAHQNAFKLNTSISGILTMRQKLASLPDQINAFLAFR